MKNILAAGMVAALLSGCAVKYAPAEKRAQAFDEPEVGLVTTARVGDHLIQKGILIEEEVVSVKSMVDGILYDIMPGDYPQLGSTDSERFYSPIGVIRGPLADQFQSLSIKSDKPNQLCVVTVFAARACYDAEFETGKRAAARDASFQQTLIYSGRIGNKINIGYREFSNSSARPAFNNDVEYDLSTSSQIGYKGALLEVLKADNSSITYKVISSFK